MITSNNIKYKLNNFSIRKKVFILMIAIFLLMLIMLYIVLYSSMEKMLWKRENDEIQNQVKIAQIVLEESYEYLPNVTWDWAEWENTYAFVLGTFDEFLEYNLNDYPYEIYDLDYITLLDVNGDIIHEQFYEHSDKNNDVGEIDLSSIYSTLGPLTVAGFEKNINVDITGPDKYSVSGFIKNNGNLFYMSSCPILNDNNAADPCLGAMIFGRIINKNDLEYLIDNPDIKVNIFNKNDLQLSDEQIESLNAGNKFVNKIGDSGIEAYGMFRDILGNDDLLISVYSPRYLYEEGIQYIKIVLTVTAICCCIIMILILALLNKTVIKPIGLFVKDVNGIDFESVNLSIETIYNNKESKFMRKATNDMLFRISKDRDIIKEKNEMLYYNANYDSLTGLKNRVNCRNSLTEEIDRAEKNSTIVGVMSLDLDRFKNINETMGHTVGDSFIVAISERMKNELKQDLIISRLGGDDFVIIVGSLKDESEFYLYADKVMSLFKMPFTVGDREIYITVSIGTSTFPSDAKEADTLIKSAEIAMYQAKKLGGNMYCRFEKSLDEIIQHKQYIENKLRRAIINQCSDFRAYFQPKALSVSGDVISCEALIRWQTPEGIISPAEFIPIAEETGLIVPLSKWMLKESCRCNKIFEKEGINQTVSVNISAQVLLHKDFMNMIKEAIEETEMDIKKLDIELTEGTVLEDMSKVKSILITLHELGITSSIDDFGTGYSSLSYLKKLPVDRIKIDQSFISGLNNADESDRSIINAIIGMGKSLNMLITAEGVEDAAQYAYLKSMDCDEIQGYYLSKPLPYEEYILFYKKWLVEKRHMKEVNKFLS